MSISKKIHIPFAIAGIQGLLDTFRADTPYKNNAYSSTLKDAEKASHELFEHLDGMIREKV